MCFCLRGVFRSPEVSVCEIYNVIDHTKPPSTRTRECICIPKRDDKEEAVDGNLVVGDDDVVPLVVQNEVLAKGKDPS